MALDVVRLTARDFSDAMDLMNMVFSMGGRPHHFQSLLPKLYQPDDGKMGAHVAIRRDGRLRAIIGHYPMTLSIGGQSFKASGIGAVSTHPEDRKSGLMRQLMQAIVAEMETEQIALSVLGGQRQRYGYYGYEKAGTHLRFSLSKTNLRHARPDLAGETYRFSRLDPTAADPQLVAQLQSWQQAQPIYVARPPEDFLTILSSWYAQIWLARDPDDQPVGYLVCNEAGTGVSELVASRTDLFLPLAAAWVSRLSAGSAEFSVPPWATTAIADLGQIAEHEQILPAYSLRINDFERLLPALLQVKADLQPLPEGTFRLGLDLDGKKAVYALTYGSGQAACRPADGPADLVLDRLTATRLLFGPLPPMLILPQLAQQPDLARLLTCWLPLPFYWPSPDEV
mgnify:FL=1